MSARLQTVLGPLTLDNPLINASGTFGYAVEYADFVDVARLGGVSVKGISLQPRPGNVPPRTVETSAGMLNSIGLANIGIDAFMPASQLTFRPTGDLERYIGEKMELKIIKLTKRRRNPTLKCVKPRQAGRNAGPFCSVRAVWCCW